MFGERPQQPLRAVLLIQVLAVALAALAFVAAFVVWRVTLEQLFAALIADAFVARFVHMFVQVALAFVVVGLMLVGEPWLTRAQLQGRLWQRFGAAAGALALITLAGAGLGWLMAR